MIWADYIRRVRDKTACTHNDTVNEFDKNESKIGFKISIQKSKVMCLNAADILVQEIFLETQNNDQLDYVVRFTYLRSVIAETMMLRLMYCAAQKDGCSVLKVKYDLVIINYFYDFACLTLLSIPTAIYANETWKTTAIINQKVDAFASSW